jgi:hypothetical protein
MCEENAAGLEKGDLYLFGALRCDELDCLKRLDFSGRRSTIEDLRKTNMPLTTNAR